MSLVGYKKGNRVRTKANVAVKRGNLTVSMFCMACGDTEAELEKHHENYNKPLDVIFLCVSCHTKIHKTRIFHDKLCIICGTAFTVPTLRKKRRHCSKLCLKKIYQNRPQCLLKKLT